MLTSMYQWEELKGFLDHTHPLRDLIEGQTRTDSSLGMAPGVNKFTSVNIYIAVRNNNNNYYYYLQELGFLLPPWFQNGIFPLGSARRGPLKLCKNSNFVWTRFISGMRDEHEVHKAAKTANTDIKFIFLLPHRQPPATSRLQLLLCSLERNEV